MTRRLSCTLAWLLVASATAASAASDLPPGFRAIQDPGGGEIVVGQFAQALPLQAAAGRILRGIATRYGGRPQLARVMRSPDGAWLAATFTVDGGAGAQRAGLALVAAPGEGPTEGAVLSDDAAHIRTSFPAMLQRLRSELGGASGAAVAHGPAAASAAAAEPVPAKATAGSTAAGTSAPAGKSAALTPTPFPDGSGSVGLPAGWRIIHAHEGEVDAQGPAGERLAFGVPIAAIDPQNPQSRPLLMRGPGGQVSTGNLIALSAQADPATAFKSIATQRAQKARRPVPQIDIQAVQELPANGVRRALLRGEVDARDGQGPMATWVLVQISPPMAMGGVQVTLHQVVVPKAQADAEAATVLAMLSSYRVNDRVVIGQIQADNRLNQAITANTLHNMANITDSTNRMAQGMSDMLRGETVINVPELNGHARVSDDLADALTRAYPDRFQAVPTSQFVRGVDY